MPVHIEKRGSMYRIVESDGQIAKTENGRARDGGGHATKAKAEKQARAINANE